jgi:hypothetical protein
MGRPTIEGYWNSGKFCPSRNQIHCLPADCGERAHTCAAYPTLRKPVPPSRTVGFVSADGYRLEAEVTIPIGGSAMIARRREL